MIAIKHVPACASAMRAVRALVALASRKLAPHALRAGIAREGAERAAVEALRPRPVFLPHGTPGMQ